MLIYFFLQQILSSRINNIYLIKCEQAVSIYCFDLLVIIWVGIMVRFTPNLQ